MMGVPPPQGPSQSSSSSSSSAPSDKGKVKKEFKLPEKKKDAGDEKGKKPSNEEAQEALQQAAAAQQIDTQIQQNLKTDQVIGQTQEVSMKQEAIKTAQLIMGLVDKMRIGEVDGKTFVNIDLKQGPEVPSFLAGSTLALTQTREGLQVSFSNFTSNALEQNAIQAIESNKEALATLVSNLQAKNIALTEFKIGTHTIALPAPTPQAVAAQIFSGGSERQQDQGQGGGGGQEQGEPDEERR